MGQVSTTAILVFANSSEQELGNKPRIESAAIFDALNQHTLNTVRNTELPYFHLTEHQQIGNSFEERFVNALEYVFNMGYSNVISVGNDSPQLSTSDLIKASKQLQSGKIVLGPSADGGIYLMGIHKADFYTEAFAKLPWKTSGLFRALMDCVSKQKEVIQLRTLFDLDNLEDLKLFISRFRSITRQLLTGILELFTLKKIRDLSMFFTYNSCYSPIFFNKGSPLAPSTSI